MSSPLFRHFASTALQHNLVLPQGARVPGQVTNDMPVYQNVRHSSARMRQYEAALRSGQRVAGQRVDSSRGVDQVRKDARLAAVIGEWASYLHTGDVGGPGNARNDAAALEGIADEMAVSVGRRDALVPMGSQGLISIMPEVYKYQHAGLIAWDEKVLKVDRTSVDPAAESYAWYESDNVGVARAANTYSTMDIPMVAGPAAQANTGRIVPFLIGMETNFMDERRARLGIANGKPDFQIDLQKREMCDRAIAEAVNFLWLYGDPLLGIDGLWNHPDVATLSLTGGPWTGKTSLQILADLVNMITVLPNAMQGSPLGGSAELAKIKIILPPNQYYLASSQIMSSAGSESVLSYFIRTMQLKPNTVTMQYDFQASNSQIYNGGPQGLDVDHALVIYEAGDKWDPKFMLPQPIEMPAPPRQNGLSETTFFHARAGGMVVADARRIRYVVGM